MTLSIRDMYTAAESDHGGMVCDREVHVHMQTSHQIVNGSRKALRTDACFVDE
jgi:hypothetical protein